MNGFEACLIAWKDPAKVAYKGEHYGLRRYHNPARLCWEAWNNKIHRWLLYIGPYPSFEDLMSDDWRVVDAADVEAGKE